MVYAEVRYYGAPGKRVPYFVPNVGRRVCCAKPDVPARLKVNRVEFTSATGTVRGTLTDGRPSDEGGVLTKPVRGFAFEYNNLAPRGQL